MSMTTFQKVTLISCSVLCVSLFLPKMLLSRGKKDIGHPDVGPGFYPPMMHRLQLLEDQEQWSEGPPYSRAHNAEVMAKVKGIRGAKKPHMMGQVIPIYGFGILLYILYIMYKLTCKVKTAKSECHDVSLTNQSMKNKTITDYELARLQEKLLQTERVMERIVSKGHVPGSGRRRRSKRAPSKKEEKLFRQLKQIAQVMEGASPEMEAEEVPYTADWEGYPEETYPEYDEPYTSRGYDTVILEEPNPELPTAEALAERMDQEEEEAVERKLDVVQEEDEEEEEEEEGEEGEEEEEEKEKQQLLSLPPILHAEEKRKERVGLEVSKELQSQNGGKRQISFSDHKDVFHYPKEDSYEEEVVEEVEEEMEKQMYDVEEEEEGIDGEDPVMEAESLTFNCGECFNPEAEAEEEKEEYWFTSVPEEDVGKEQGLSGLRMRNRRET